MKRNIIHSEVQHLSNRNSQLSPCQDNCQDIPLLAQHSQINEQDTQHGLSYYNGPCDQPTTTWRKCGCMVNCVKKIRGLAEKIGSVG